MVKARFTYLYLVALWLVTSLSGCATSGDLDKLKQELQQSIVDKTAPIEPLTADTKTKFNVLKNDIVSLSQEVNGLRNKVGDIGSKSESLVKEREKIHAMLQSAKRRILFLFKTEDAELKDRIQFLEAAMKDFEAEEPSTK